MHPCTPMYAITHTQSLTPLPLSLPTHNTQAQLHSQVMGIHNANLMHTKTNLCKYVYTSLPLFPLSLTTHPCTHYTQNTSLVTFHLLQKLQTLHSTSVSEFWSAIAARILAEEQWGGRQCRDSFVSVEQPLIPFSIS